MTTADGITLLVQAAVVKYRLQWTPEPLGAAAPANLFSEQRALEHIRRLTVTGRLVSHPDLESAVHYILRCSEELAADAASRDDVVVQVGSYLCSEHSAYQALDTLPYRVLTGLIRTH